MIFISTDYVFGGIKSNHIEDDDINPANYGTTRRRREKAVAQICNNHVIGRPSSARYSMRRVMLIRLG
jgi:dTDP-4-dehydrorhamnose reductase